MRVTHPGLPSHRGRLWWCAVCSTHAGMLKTCDLTAEDLWEKEFA